MSIAVASAAAQRRRAGHCLAAAALSCALVACGGVSIRPQAALPKPLIQPIPASVGLLIPPDVRDYTHKETRWGVDWQVALGSGHTQMMQSVFKYAFTEVEEFKDLDTARAAKDLKAIFEPRIDQYSFVTARETGGRYYAVTIRYRINLYTPQGEKVDSLTLTGYGNALARGMSSSAPLVRASLAAMRDAAAKFLVQFPDQPLGQQLGRNEALAVEKTAAAGDKVQIEAVPIEDPVADTGSAPAAPPAAEPPAHAPPPGTAPAPAAPQPTASGAPTGSKAVPEARTAQGSTPPKTQ